MYRAKNLGKSNYQYFASKLDVQIHRRMALEMKLRKGLELDKFELLLSTSGTRRQRQNCLRRGLD